MREREREREKNKGMIKLAVVVDTTPFDSPRWSPSIPQFLRRRLVSTLPFFPSSLTQPSSEAFPTLELYRTNNWHAPLWPQKLPASLDNGRHRSHSGPTQNTESAGLKIIAYQLVINCSNEYLHRDGVWLGQLASGGQLFFFNLLMPKCSSWNCRLVLEYFSKYLRNDQWIHKIFDRKM